MKYIFSRSASGYRARKLFYKGTKPLCDSVGDFLVMFLFFGVVFIALSILN